MANVACHNPLMFLTIPTIMTWTRIVAIPLIVGVFYLPLDAPTRNLVATVLFVTFALTDWPLALPNWFAWIVLKDSIRLIVA